MTGARDGLHMAFAGGGTGGHLFPGLAVAELALAERVARSVVFFGAERGIESRLIPSRGHDLVAQKLEGMHGRSPAAAVRALGLLATAVRDARHELEARSIDVVVGLGGYASSSAVLAAALSRIPIVILEQNRDPGWSNKTLGRMAKAVCTSFEETAKAFGRGKARLTGNPVREDLAVGVPYRAAERSKILVFGGSGGARGINRALPKALAEAASELATEQAVLPKVLHQTGSAALEDVRAAYADENIDADVRPFIDDMRAAYSEALVAVCRAGATTVAELVATGTPSILIPFPLATGDHQTANAKALADAGAGLLVEENDSTPDKVAAHLVQLLRDSDALDSMAAEASRLYRPGAAARVLAVIREVCELQA